MTSRIVVLLDMDCFYCQVEQRLNPELKGKPVAVVQYKKWKGGGIIAVNYEARKFGVNRSMRGDEAKAKCPEINLVRVRENREKADITIYRDAGREVIDVLCRFSNCVERASIDEAYIDLTDAVEQRMLNNPIIPDSIQLPQTFVIGYDPIVKGDNEEKDRQDGLEAWLSNVDNDEQSRRLAYAAMIVEEMRAAVLNETGFTCSAGIAHNKPLSKLVCGFHKPARQTVLPFDKITDLYSTLPVKKVRSLGGKLGDTLVQTLGITLMSELLQFSEHELCQRIDPKNGSWLYNIARGIDNDPVNARLIPKSIGCCKRFPGKTSLGTQQEVEHWLRELAKEVSERLNKDMEENRRRARGITVQWSLEIGGSGFSKTGILSSYDPNSIASEAIFLISKASNAPVGSNLWKPPIQFLGINASKFSEEVKASSISKFFKPVAKTLDESTSEKPKESLPNESIDKIAPNKSKSFFLNLKEEAKKLTNETVTSSKAETVTSSTGETASKKVENVTTSKAETSNKKIETVHDEPEEQTNSSLDVSILDLNKFSEAEKSKSFFFNLRKKSTAAPATETSSKPKEEEEVKLPEAVKIDNSPQKKFKSFFIKNPPEATKTSNENVSMQMQTDNKEDDVEIIEEKSIRNKKSIVNFFNQIGESSVKRKSIEEQSNQELAPCPQCGKSIKIIDMSDHLDHHVAEELHRQLNGLPQPSTTSTTNASTNNAQSAPAQPSKKRKYNKQKQAGNKSKMKTIQSFFGQN